MFIEDLEVSHYLHLSKERNFCFQIFYWLFIVCRFNWLSHILLCCLDWFQWGTINNTVIPSWVFQNCLTTPRFSYLSMQMKRVKGGYQGCSMKEGVLTNFTKFAGGAPVPGSHFLYGEFCRGGRESWGIGFWSLIFGWGAGRWPV